MSPGHAIRPDRVVYVVIAGLLLLALAVVAVQCQGESRTDNVKRQLAAEFQRDQTQRLRQGCERRKIADRRGALSWLAHRNYLVGVIGAASVKGDVKALADIALRTHRKTVLVLMRFARIDCAAKYPLPGEAST